MKNLDLGPGLSLTEDGTLYVDCDALRRHFDATAEEMTDFFIAAEIRRAVKQLWGNEPAVCFARVLDEEVGPQRVSPLDSDGPGAA